VRRRLSVAVAVRRAERREVGRAGKDGGDTTGENKEANDEEPELDIEEEEETGTTADGITSGDGTTTTHTPHTQRHASTANKR
jgi:hypothetical protein